MPCGPQAIPGMGFDFVFLHVKLIPVMNWYPAPHDNKLCGAVPFREQRLNIIGKAHSGGSGTVCDIKGEWNTIDLNGAHQVFVRELHFWLMELGPLHAALQ